MGHAGSNDFEASGFETGINLADHVFCNCVWLDDGEGTLGAHAGLFLRGFYGNFWMKFIASLSKPAILTRLRGLP
jgi:hypothetical protein